MLEHIVEALSKCSFILSIEILEYIDEETVQFIKIKATLNNSSILYAREFLSHDKSKYLYYWQTSDGKLILRWDNAPHHSQLATFPHHVHKGKNVFPSYRVFIDEVLAEIEKHLHKQLDN